ncbi:MAG: hypothetical protein ACYC6A_22105 [Armatimonadota bacterium]
MLSPDLFAAPPREFGMMPFWFWNDELTDEEIVRQIRELHAKGCGGFIPHARTGLSRRVGYLTPEFFRLIRVAVEEAARLGMKVVLYDEGAYPSGSAQGRVTAENPAWAARCLIALQHEVIGPKKGFWRPNPGRAMGDRLVCVVQGREAEGGLDPESLTVLPVREHEVVPYDVPASNWRLVAVWDVASGGTIRGVFDEEEDGSALAPAAADILNPDAVAAFLRYTHEQYAAHLGDFFGTTVVGMFTDEPNPLGRGPQRGPHPQPYTPGLLDEVPWEDVLRWLPALWLECGPRTEAFRHTYHRAVQDRLERVFYGAQAEWCTAHGLALTGHPHASNEMAVLRRFAWPGQDMVWRWVEPGSPSALEGPDSVAAKSAHSAAVLDGRRFNTSEVLGAYGWRLTLDEAKWLLDWHAVRGTNLFFPHAAFYSIRDRRAFESEPDIGLHNAWWPYWGLLGDYIRRLCWLFSDGEDRPDVGIYADPNNLPWTAAKLLLQSQVSFIYIDEEHVRNLSRYHISGLIVDPPGPPPAIHCPIFSDWTPEILQKIIDANLRPHFHWDGSPDLRVRKYRKDRCDLYLLVNEGEEAIEGTISLYNRDKVERWDPLTGTISAWPVRIENDRSFIPLRLERRESVVLVIDHYWGPDPQAVLPPVPGAVVREIGGWQAEDVHGSPVAVPCPGDWSQMPGWELFTGALVFRATFTLTAGEARARFLDLGRVGDIAEVTLNGNPAGVRAWAPYVLPVALREGENTLAVRVTNSMANAYDGLQLPSGLIGPVALRA